jgi:hypothetical protein
MAIKDQQVSLYAVLEVIAKEWISAVPGFYIHDVPEDLRHLESSDAMLGIVSTAFGAPTTTVNFVKAYLKTEYVAAIKQYLVENGNEAFADTDFIAPLPIKVTQADIDAA